MCAVSAQHTSLGLQAWAGTQQGGQVQPGHQGAYFPEAAGLTLAPSETTHQRLSRLSWLLKGRKGLAQRNRGSPPRLLGPTEGLASPTSSLFQVTPDGPASSTGPGT